MMELYKSIKHNNVSVSIDGHGADEQMSGYGDIPLALHDAGLNPKKIKNILDTLKFLHNQDTSQLSNTTYNWEWYIRYLIFYYGKKNLIPQFTKALFNMHRKQQEHRQDSVFNAKLYTVFHKTILPTLLRNYDRYSMSQGVEIRMPFMDYRLVSFSFALPWESKIRNGYSKSIIRDAMKGIVYDDIRLRKSKIGFNTPIVDWLQGPWKSFILDTIHSNEFNQSQTINPIAVKKQVENVIFKPNAMFSEGELAWSNLMPFFWEKSVLNKKL